MIPAEIRSCLTRQHGVRSIAAMSPGLSGARVFRCTGKETLVLRCWPDDTNARRVKEIHTIISAVATTFDLLPKYKSLGPHGGTVAIDAAERIWELATWMPGQPLADDASLQSIGTGAAVIADMHHAMGRLGQWQQPVPAIAQRLQRLAWLDQHLPRCLATNLQGRVHPGVAVALGRACRLLQQKWPTTAARLTAALTPLERQRWPLQYVLRDIHREHMLFSAGKVVGIIDFDALRVDATAVDLARWAVSFSQYRDAPEETIDRVLADYWGATPFPERQTPHRFGDSFFAAPVLDAAATNGRPAEDPAETHDSDPGFRASDAPEFRTLVLTIADSSLWISLANWVVWLVGESRQFPDLQLVSERLGRLIESVDG